MYAHILDELIPKKLGAPLGYYRYIDDIVIVSKLYASPGSTDSLEEFKICLKRAAQSSGFWINERKTTIMAHKDLSSGGTLRFLGYTFSNKKGTIIPKPSKKMRNRLRLARYNIKKSGGNQSRKTKELVKGLKWWLKPNDHHYQMLENIKI
jgi:hypothetical protein